MVPAGELDNAAMGLAKRLADNAPLGLQLGKEAVYAMSDMEQSKAYRYAADMISINIDTEDYVAFRKYLDDSLSEKAACQD